MLTVDNLKYNNQFERQFCLKITDDMTYIGRLSSEKTSQGIYLSGFRLKEEHQGKGYGGFLLEYVKDYFKQFDMYLQAGGAGIGNKNIPMSARQTTLVLFYNRYGFLPRKNNLDPFAYGTYLYLDRKKINADKNQCYYMQEMWDKANLLHRGRLADLPMQTDSNTRRTLHSWSDFHR